jgi:hypothetical protein
MATPTVYTGMENTFTASVTIVRQLDEALRMMDPKSYPLLQRVGLNSLGEEVFNPKYEFQFDYLIPSSDALDGAIAATGSTEITVKHPEYFALHDVIMVESELMRVIGADITGNKLIVERGFAGSTAATHDDNDVIYKLGPARPEGSAPGWAMQTVVSAQYNYCQIWDTDVSINGTQEATRNYAPEDLLAYRLEKRMAELFIKMERSLWYGLRYQGSANTGRMSGGLDQFVLDKDNLSDAALEYDDLVDALQNVHDRVGMANMPETLWCNGWVRRKISSWGLSTIRTTQAETSYGSTIDVIDTDFGTLQISLDHLLIPSEVWLLKMDEIKCGPLRGRGFKEIDASIPGEDATRRRVLGEYVWYVGGEDGSNQGPHVKIYGVSTTA